MMLFQTFYRYERRCPLGRHQLDFLRGPFDTINPLSLGLVFDLVTLDLAATGAYPLGGLRPS
jgi:hypothetical protein